MNMNLIDEFRRRTNASYDQARYYLERFNWDLLEAIIAYETENITYSKEYRTQHRSGRFVNWLIRTIQRLFDIKVIVTDKNFKSFSVPIILPLILFPVWHTLFVLAVVMYIIGYRFSFREIPDPNINVESFVEKMRNRMNQW